MGWNPVKEAEKKAKQAIDKIIKPATKAAEAAIWKCRKAAWAAVMDAKNKSIRAVNAARDDSTKAIRMVGEEIQDGIKEEMPGLIHEVGEKVEEAVTEDLPEKVKKVVHDLAEEASQRSIKEALDNAADVIEIMAPSRFALIFGIEIALVVQGEITVSVGFPNPAAKLTEIRKWAEKPPKGRKQIIECIKDFAPDSLSVEAKLSGNGLVAEWDGEEKYDRIDAFLEKHGVD